jgi:hypothetical protein
MKRTLLRIVLAGGFVVAGWALGNGQERVADFEITIEAPRGDVNLICARGCAWGEKGSPGQPISFKCETQRCRATFNGHGRITLGDPDFRRN